MKSRPVLVIALMTVLLLSACNLPVAPSATPTGEVENVLTAAARTAEAAQTLQSGQTATATTAALPPTSTFTPLPNPATATYTRVPPTNTPQPCDAAGFIQDVTIPDGTKMAPGQTFTKTWRLRNNGTCTWNRNYGIVFASGDAMGAPAFVNLPGDVPPNATVDISVDMKAPNTPGKYTGNWRLRNAAGVIFGVEGDTPFYVIIEVVALTPTVTATATITPTPQVITPTFTVTPTPPPGPGVIYDLAANVCQAEWRTASGALNCPGLLGDPKGAVAVLPSPTLETGDVETQIVLLTQPEGVQDGAIAGIFPNLAIQSGYHFRATLGCLGGQTNCSVKYQLNYREGTGQPQNLGQWSQTYDGMIQGIDVDLTPLAGKTVQLILVVVADGPSSQDAALWVYPRVTKG